MRTGIAVCCALLVAAVLIAGGARMFRASPGVPPRELRDPPLRIVSVAPSVTEMLFSLGVGDAVVGVTNCCDFPPEAKQVECIGEFGRPNIERLLALSPDLVISAGWERNELAQALRDSGIRVLDLTVRNLDELFEGFRQIGQAVGQPRRAEEVVAGMQAELAAVAVEHAHAPGRPRPRVFVEFCNNPLTTAGGTSFLDDVITRAGGVNVAHGISQAYLHVSAEKVIEWNPDVIVATYMTESGDASSGFAGRIGWAEISAVKNRRIISDIPADYLFRPGPRLIKGVRALAQRLHGTSPEDRFVVSKVDQTCP